MGEEAQQLAEAAGRRGQRRVGGAWGVWRQRVGARGDAARRRRLALRPKSRAPAS
jgi:hypothetical protein